MATAQEAKQFHPLPVIGYPEAYYAKHIKDADSHGDKIAHEAYKVGQYITLGLDPAKKWTEKLKYFCHALTAPYRAAAGLRRADQGLFRPPGRHGAALRRP